MLLLPVVSARLVVAARKLALPYHENGNRDDKRR
jgi:hypothetical protein